MEMRLQQPDGSLALCEACGAQLLVIQSDGKGLGIAHCPRCSTTEAAISMLSLDLWGEGAVRGLAEYGIEAKVWEDQVEPPGYRYEVRGAGRFENGKAVTEAGARRCVLLAVEGWGRVGL